MEQLDIFKVSDIRGYIKDLNEDTLIENIIIPLYQKRGYLLIKRPSHGPGEHGKDIIFRIESFHRPIYHAIQAKAEKINVNNVGKVIDQAKAAFNVSFKDLYSNFETKVDFVEVITSGKVTDDAEKRFYDEINNRRHITIIGGEQLIDLIEKTKEELPKIKVSVINVNIVLGLSGVSSPINEKKFIEIKIQNHSKIPVFLKSPRIRIKNETDYFPIIQNDMTSIPVPREIGKLDPGNSWEVLINPARYSEEDINNFDYAVFIDKIGREYRSSSEEMSKVIKNWKNV